MVQAVQRVYWFGRFDSSKVGWFLFIMFSYILQMNFIGLGLKDEKKSEVFFLGTLVMGFDIQRSAVSLLLWALA